MGFYRYGWNTPTLIILKICFQWRNQKNIWTSSKVVLICKISQKRRGLYLQNWRIYGYFYSKTKMAVAGLIFEPHSPNFENQYNFWTWYIFKWYQNDFLISLLVSNFQRSVWECSVHICSCPCSILHTPAFSIGLCITLKIWKCLEKSLTYDFWCLFTEFGTDWLTIQICKQPAPTILISLASENSFEVKNDETNARVFSSLVL